MGSRPSFRVLLLFVLLTVVMSGCRPLVGPKAAAPGAVRLEACLAPDTSSMDPEEKAGCIPLLERELEKAAAGPRSGEIVLRLGRFYLETGQYEAAYQLFHDFQEKYGPAEGEGKMKARLYLGVTLYFLDRPVESLEVLHAMAEDPKAAALAGDVARYIAEDYVKMGRLSSALTWYARCREAVEEGPARQRVEERILDVVCLGWKRRDLREAAAAFPEGFFSEAVRLGVAASYVEDREVGVAEDLLLRMAAEHPDDLFTARIRSLLAGVAPEAGLGACTIGCLLPLSGQYARFGTSILDALLLASKAFGGGGDREARIRLLIRDTEGDPEAAVAGLRDLAGNPSVMGIVGPLRASVSMACAREAQALGIPIIALTQREEVAAVGDYVFQNGLTVRQQVETLVDYVTDKMGIGSFAVLYPRDPYGKLSRDLLEQKVLEVGGELVSAVSYDEAETDFQDEIRQLVGEAYLEEVEQWRKAREEERRLEEEGTVGLKEEGGEGEIRDETVEAAKGEEGEEEQEPEPPFQALFIPDHYRKVALIAPHLALFDVNEITLLGTNAWNSPQLVELAGEYVRDAIFVDGFFSESAMPNVRDFVEAYRDAFDTVPRVLEAQGYDSLLILENAFLRAGEKNREGVREALATMDGYPGLSGYTLFREDGSAKKRLYILSVVGNHIEQIY